MMASPIDMHEGGKDNAWPQDVFHTPPEESSLPSSDEHRPLVAAADVDFSDVSQALDVDVGTKGSVNLCGFSNGAVFSDLGKDSVLGFDSEMVAEVEGVDASGDDSGCNDDEIRVSKSESSDLGFSEDASVDAEMVDECEGDGVPGQDFECNVDEIEVSKRESSVSGESPVKKLKLSEQDIGFGSSGEFLGSESQKTEEGVENCKGKLVSDADTKTPCDFGENLEPQENVPEPQILGSGAHLETQEVAQTENKENAGAVNFSEAGKSPKSSDEVVEASGTMEKNGSELKGCVIPPSLHVFLDDIANNFVSEKEGEKIEDTFSYKVVKYILEKYGEDNLEKIDWLEILQNSGVTFPCPRWWPENYEELNYNTNGLKLERDWKGN